MTEGHRWRVVAVVPDLLDRSRLAAPGCDITHVRLGRLPAAVAEGDVDLVVVDLSRAGAVDAVAGLPVPVIGFAPHVDDELFERARVAGVDALARSVFFRRWPAVGPIGTGAED